MRTSRYFVPLYNEEQASRCCSAKCADSAHRPITNSIFVDDGSHDELGRGSQPIRGRLCSELRKKVPDKARLFSLDCRRSAAILAVLIDGELWQMIRTYIPRLLAYFPRGADLVCGYRARRQDTLLNRITIRVANFVRSRFTGTCVAILVHLNRRCERYCSGRWFHLRHAPFHPRIGERSGISAG